ncbi:hypothetical protein mvi_137 [Megavirus vitis]|uniref:Uncharacterized protein n=1 Tax=Megavirus courdo7 TaxID=1128135 RepID=H2E9Z7_9VIRU|nr:hypothetical protein c7_L154 [Megavirus courdo7]AVL93497.1 hypothetical protein mvi_137 [Megavirus vitis]
MSQINSCNCPMILQLNSPQFKTQPVENQINFIIDESLKSIASLNNLQIQLLNKIIFGLKNKIITRDELNNLFNCMTASYSQINNLHIGINNLYQILVEYKSKQHH